jgi:hypothetical protein
MTTSNNTVGELVVDDTVADETIDAWEDLCWNPNEAFINDGRQEGHDRGLFDGFQDGLQLGRTKGIEFGMELGYYRGFVKVLKQKYNQQQQESTASEKIQKSLEELSRAITADFPNPDEMFSNQRGPLHHDVNHNEDHNHGTDHVSNETRNERNQNVSFGESSAKVDVVGKMQRIRVKFKLLMRLLKLPHVTLQSLMADARQDSPSASSSVSTASNLPNTLESYDVSDW